MPKYDVWFYAITVEAEGETEAIAKINRALDRAAEATDDMLTKELIESIQVSYAEEI